MSCKEIAGETFRHKPFLERATKNRILLYIEDLLQFSEDITKKEFVPWTDLVCMLDDENEEIFCFHSFNELMLDKFPDWGCHDNAGFVAALKEQHANIPSDSFLFIYRDDSTRFDFGLVRILP